MDLLWRYNNYPPRMPVMKNMLKDNIALITMQQVKGEDFRHAFISSKISNKFTLSSKSSNVSYHFPLFAYGDESGGSLIGFTERNGEAKVSNIKPEIFTALSKAYRTEVFPEGIFYYVYAVLYSEIFRKKYAELLKIDFPRVSFTNDYKLLKKYLSTETGLQTTDTC